MRTSGAGSERWMVIVIVLIVFGFSVVLAGGPRDLMVDIQDALKAVAGAIVQAYQNARA
jgi:hypothetical protein